MWISRGKQADDNNETKEVYSHTQTDRERQQHLHTKLQINPKKWIFQSKSMCNVVSILVMLDCCLLQTLFKLYKLSFMLLQLCSFTFKCNVKSIDILCNYRDSITDLMSFAPNASKCAQFLSFFYIYFIEWINFKQFSRSFFLTFLSFDSNVTWAQPLALNRLTEHENKFVKSCIWEW